MAYTKVPDGFKGARPAAAKDVTKWASWMGPEAGALTPVNAVFKGGGPKGTAFAGVLEELEGKVAYRAISGASAGAITAALVAAGYSAATLKQRIARLDFRSLLDERNWDDDHKVQEAWRGYNERESPDVVTRVIRENTQLHAMMAAAEGEEDWSQKGWGAYLWDYGAWLLNQTDKATGSVFSAIAGETVGGWSYWAAKRAASYFSGYGWYLTGAQLLGAGVEMARSYWNSEETNPIVLAQKLAPSGPAFLSWFLSWKLRRASLPGAIRDKLQDSESTLKILLGMYYLGGAFKGDFALHTMEKWLQEALYGEYREDRTVKFSDMPIPLNIVATDLTNRRLLNFPYGLMEKPYRYSRAQAEAFPVAKAVRASMSIPVCFEPVELPYMEGDADAGNRALLVDGGVLSNFPVHPFVDDTSHRTVGFWLGDSADEIAPTDVTTLVGYGAGTFGALQDAHDRTMVKLMGDRLVNAEIDLTIPLTADEEKARQKRVDELLGKIAKAAKGDKSVAQWNLSMELLAALEAGRPCETLDFALTDEQKEALIANGRKAGRQVLVELGLALAV